MLAALSMGIVMLRVLMQWPFHWPARPVAAQRPAARRQQRLAWAFAVVRGGQAPSDVQPVADAAPRQSELSVSIRDVEQLRLLRRSLGMTYCELARHTGLPVRLLAAIEHGMRAPEPEQIQRIVVVLSDVVQAAGAGAEGGA